MRSQAEPTDSILKSPAPSRILILFVIFLNMRLTNRVMSGSRLHQHMEQRGIVGKGSHVQGDQALLANPVHPFLPVSLPVLVFLLSSLPHAASSSSTAGVVSGQQALYGQSVLIFHCLPQGLVLMGEQGKGAGPIGGERQKRRVHTEKEIYFMR